MQLMEDTLSIPDLAAWVFEDAEKAKRWLNKPKRQFGGLTPLEKLNESGGEIQVRELLVRIDTNATSI